MRVRRACRQLGEHLPEVRVTHEQCGELTACVKEAGSHGEHGSANNPCYLERRDPFELVQDEHCTLSFAELIQEVFEGGESELPFDLLIR